MSEARATSKYIRLSPRRVRQVVDLIRGKNIGEALAILKFTPQRAATAVEKVVKSAVANAEHNLEMSKDSLFIAEAYVDQGPTLKRFNPRAMGRADLMRRRTSHITIVVQEKEEVKREEKAGKQKDKAKEKEEKKETAVQKKVKKVPEKKRIIRRKKETVPESKETAPEKKKPVRKKKEG